MNVLCGRTQNERGANVVVKPQAAGLGSSSSLIIKRRSGGRGSGRRSISSGGSQVPDLIGVMTTVTVPPPPASSAASAVGISLANNPAAAGGWSFFNSRTKPGTSFSKPSKTCSLRDRVMTPSAPFRPAAAWLVPFDKSTAGITLSHSQSIGRRQRFFTRFAHREASIDGGLTGPVYPVV
jgi:hypothetical protein